MVEPTELAPELMGFRVTSNTYATEEGECIQVAILDALYGSANEALCKIARDGGQIIDITPLARSEQRSGSYAAFIVVYRIALPPVQE